ncbi:MAG: hypothetical protein VX519_00685 [Myxococcota bacterium]|nr:hypothetical protein [Myxococcota bacterium]
MSEPVSASPLLQSTVRHVVGRLITEKGLEVRPGSAEAIIAFCIERLSDPKPGAQLVSTIVGALLASPDVMELYASNEDIKVYITDSRNF